ncbi:ATPase, AAA family [Aphelenchoides fujianensis]|nr:ATPase, AAA family [Aphelenchoides fujianensis]
MSARKKNKALTRCPRCDFHFLSKEVEKHPADCRVDESTLHVRPGVSMVVQSGVLEKHKTHLPSDAFGWSRTHTVLVNSETLDLLGVLPRSPCVLTAGTERFVLISSERTVRLEVVRNPAPLAHLQLYTATTVDQQLLDTPHFAHYLRLYLSEAFISPSLPLVVKYLARDIAFEVHEDDADRMARCKAGAGGRGLR